MQTGGHGHPYVKLVLLGDVQRGLRTLLDQFHLPPPQMEQAGMKQGIGHAERVIQPVGQGHGVVGPFERTIREAKHP